MGRGDGSGGSYANLYLRGDGSNTFGGSGTTLLAAEKNGRIAYLMELDPKYCDVI